MAFGKSSTGLNFFSVIDPRIPNKILVVDAEQVPLRAAGNVMRMRQTLFLILVLNSFASGRCPATSGWGWAFGTI